MTIELSAPQLAILHDTREAATPAEFQSLLASARPEMDRVVREVQVPSQPIGTTLVELRDLSLTVSTYEAQLATVNYGPARRALFRDAIRLVATAALWLGEGARTGAFRTRTVSEVIEASRPWRQRLKACAAQAFVFEPEVADLFADVNSTGTLEEETRDLETLNHLIQQHAGRLAHVGMKSDTVAQGQTLLDEASGRDLRGVLGLRNQEEALLLRNRILTYATLLGAEARASGINACFDDDAARRRFEATSFRNALRRLRPSRRKSTAVDETPAPAANATSATDTQAKGITPS
jgi:hypothetical protein